MYWVWYWAILDREIDGRILASIPDLGDLAAYGANEMDAVARAAELAAGHVRALVESGQPVPRPRHASEMPTNVRTKDIARAMISVPVGRAAAKPAPPSGATD